MDKKILYSVIAVQCLLPLCVLFVNVAHYLVTRKSRRTSVWYTTSRDKLAIASWWLLGVMQVFLLAGFFIPLAGDLFQYTAMIWFVFVNVAAIIRRNRYQATSL